MSQTAISTKQETYDAGTARVDMKLEVEPIAVSDVDRAKQFYTKLRWRLDADDVMGPGLSRRPVHTTGFRVLDHVRQGSHHGCAWRSPGWTDRLRH